jgi:hypothetical protein
VSPWSEVIRDPRVHREEALSLPHRFESSHCSFSLASRLVRIFGSVVQAPRPMMSHVGDDIPGSGAVARELISHDCPRHEL